MRFVLVPGTAVAFSVWETRVRDYETFVTESRHAADGGMISLNDGQLGKHGHTWRGPGYDQTDDHPVVGVSWEDAKAFCAWLTARERAAGLLSAAQSYRLPTDDEWSRAAGLAAEEGETPEERDSKIEGVYPWGTQWPPPKGAGNFADATWKVLFPDNKTIDGYDDGYPTTAPVGQFAPNALGLFDLSGNVWECCEDPAEPGSVACVRRGGSWLSEDPKHLLSSNRNLGRPAGRYDVAGFRCVLVLGPSR